MQRVDWTRTRAFALAQGPLYINRRVVQDETEYEDLRNDLIARLEALQEPETNLPLFKKVYRREDLYHGPFVHRAPHLVALNHDAFHNRAGLSQPDVFAKAWRWKGNNRHHGLFILAGPGVAQRRVTGARLIDLAPTILHLCGVGAPADMDGRVLTEALDGQLVRNNLPVQPSIAVNGSGTLDSDHDAAVRSRLEGLGYL